MESVNESNTQENLMNCLNFAWSRGYSGKKVAFVDEKVVAYVCGVDIKFISNNPASLGSDSEKRYSAVFQFPGQGLGTFSAHRSRCHFSISETCLNPRIYVYNYPDLEEISCMKGGAKLSYSHVEFSSSVYLASLSSLPDYTLTLWRYETGQKLCSSAVSHMPATSLQFNPGNWRQICVTMESEISVWFIEPCDDIYWIKRKKIRLPGVNDSTSVRIQSVRAGSRFTQYSLDLPKVAVAGLVGEIADNFNDIQDSVLHVKPVSQAWTVTGDIYIGCEGAQILLINGENLDVVMKYNPLCPQNLQTDSSQIIIYTGMQTQLPPGSVSHMAMHKHGLYVAGDDGVIRLLNINDQLSLVEESHIGKSITCMSFNQVYTDLVLGSSQGSIYNYEMGVDPCPQTLVEIQYGNIIGVTSVYPGDKYILTVREEGAIQTWTIDTGWLLSTAMLGDTARCVSSSPIMPITVIGSAEGYLYFYDCSNVQILRLVQRVHLVQEPISHLIAEQFGSFFLAGIKTSQQLYFISGSPDYEFQPFAFTDFSGDMQTVSMVTSTPSYDVTIVVTFREKDEVKGKGAATHVMQITLYHSILGSLPDSDNLDIFVSKRNDFKKDILNKLVYSFREPIFGACNTYCNILYGIGYKNKKLLKYEIPEKKPHRRDTEGWILSPSDEADAHKMAGGRVFMNKDHRFILTAGSDGLVTLRTTENMYFMHDIESHHYKDGGATAVMMENHRLFSIGHDNVIACYHIDMELLNSNSSDCLDVKTSSSQQMLLVNKIKELPAFGAPHQTDTSELEHTESYKSEDSVSSARKSSIEIPEMKDMTWPKMRELEARKQEDQGFLESKKDLKNKILEMQNLIQEMIRDNDNRPEIEQLGHHEFDLDLDEQQRLQTEGDKEVNWVKEVIEYENLARMYIREEIKKECWDNMVVKGRCIKAFSTKIEVSNYPLSERSKATIAELEHTCDRRAMEMEELQIRRKLLESGLKLSGEGSDVQLEVEDELVNREQITLSGNIDYEKSARSVNLYSQFDLHSRLQKISQIVILLDNVHFVKQNFNKEFSDVYAKKELEMQKINDKNKRIVKILSDLNLSDKIIHPELSDEERPEHLLTVKDEEVTVEKYLSEAQRRKLEEEHLKEEERLRLERGDNWRERGLDKMMGGLLEVKKEDELKKDIPVPQFMKDEKPITDWTEDEQKAAKEYERKCAELEEEREKFRKQLETELRKLQALIQEGMVNFDEILHQLSIQKIKSQMIIYQEELKIVRLQYSLLLEEELETRELQLNYLQEVKLAAKATAATQLLEVRQHYETFRENYDILLAEDKILDKQFKREFNDCSLVQVEHLYKLFRKRPKIQKYKASESISNAMNPYLARPSTAEKENYTQNSLENYLNESDKPIYMPDGIDANVWERFCRLRRQKVESEINVKLKTNIMADIMKFCATRQDEDERLKDEVEDIAAELSKLREERLRYLYDLEVQLVMKQGQVEIDVGSFTPNYLHSVLVHRNVIEDLNIKIKSLGEKKISSMLTSKKFKKGIVKLEWEYKRILMSIEDLRNKMTDVTFMKVTREIQSYLKNKEEYDAIKVQEATSLEKTITLRRQFHEQQLKGKRFKMQKLMKKLKVKSKDNGLLGDQLTSLNVTVNERRHIDENYEKETLGNDSEARYQRIVQRSKLMELAKAQAQEVAILRAEVERLRMRTFPALVQMPPH